METIERQIRKRLQMGWKVLSSFSMAISCGSVSQRTLAALDIYPLTSSTWPGSKHLQSLRKHIFNLCPKWVPVCLGGGRHWGSLEDMVAWKGVMEEKRWQGQLLMCLLLDHALSGWRRRLPSETRNVQRHCRQPETFSESHIALLHTQLAGAGSSDYQRAHKSKTFVSV